MRRRTFLKRIGKLTMALGFSHSLTNQGFAAMLPTDLTRLSAIDLSEAIRDKHVSCLEVMQAYLSRISKYNSVYNAIVSVQPEEELLDQARKADAELASGHYRGWMHGMPHAVKDLTAVEGIRHTSGSLLYVDRIAERDSPMVARIRDAGAIFIGKTNTPEFGLGSQSYNSVFGATGCAYDPELTSGGSSGGAGCGLGTQMLPVADGSDMMGSLRNPAAFNNVIGFRPSVNVMSGTESVPRALSTSGPMGRNTADTIALLDTIASICLDGDFNALDLSTSKFAWMGNLDGYLAMEDGVLDLCEASLNQVAATGASVEATTPLFNFNDLWLCWTTLRHGGRASMRRYWDDPETRGLLKDDLAWEIQQSMSITAGDKSNANRIRQAWDRELDRLFNQYDFLVWPTAQLFPYDKNTPWPTQISGRSMDTYHRWMEVVMYASLGGLPTVNVPVGFDAQSRPMGMQVMGRYGEDKKVLEFALAYENITDFLDARPNLVAAS
ncbi:MAG TPA: amidase [Gammaproteobacteria bacterium]|nr:amidase [Gammaproteobacteria bacterium]